jgi:hypothetical protein
MESGSHALNHLLLNPGVFEEHLGLVFFSKVSFASILRLYAQGKTLQIFQVAQNFKFADLRARNQTYLEFLTHQRFSILQLLHFDQLMS